MEEHLEDLEPVEPVPNIEFEIGDNVVYPHHGAGKVIRKEQKDVLGEKREYLTIKILHNDMTVMVPTANAAVAGLRRVIDEETVKKVLAVLQDECSEMPKNWNRRFKHNRDKIKTGDIYELAEVVRNLALRETEKGLSTGEKQMFTRAKKILASGHCDRAIRGSIDGLRGQRDDDPLDARYSEERLHAPLEHWPAPNFYERLGPVQPKALATARGHDQGDRHGKIESAPTS